MKKDIFVSTPDIEWKDINFYHISAPFHITFLLTEKCNLNCGFCGVNSPGKKEIEISRAIDILDQLSLNEVPMVSYSGGEPLLYPHLFEILAEGKKRNFIQSLTTNGRLLSNKLAKELGAFVRNITVSLHGTNEINNQLVGHSSYDEVIKNFKTASTHLPVSILYTATSLNYDYNNLLHIAEIAKNSNSSVFVARMICVGRSTPDLRLSLTEIIDLVSNIDKLQNEGYPIQLTDSIPLCVLPERYHHLVKNCSAGVKYGAVDSQGNVRICPQSPEIIGSLFNGQSLEEIWQSNVLKRLRALKWAPLLCKGCLKLPDCKMGCKIENPHHHFDADSYFYEYIELVWELIKNKLFKMVDCRIRETNCEVLLYGSNALRISSHLGKIIHEFRNGVKPGSILENRDQDISEFDLKQFLVKLYMDNYIIEA